MTEATAETEMLVRRPIEEVFDAFVDPRTITKFWLESTSGPLAPGVRVDWRFLVPGATETATVVDFERPHLIAFRWSDGVRVSLSFEPYAPDATRVSARASGFGGDTLQQVVNATEGFSIVLCDLKTLLETGRSANLVRDKAELVAGAAR